MTTQISPFTATLVNYTRDCLTKYPFFGRGVSLGASALLHAEGVNKLAHMLFLGIKDVFVPVDEETFHAVLSECASAFGMSITSLFALVSPKVILCKPCRPHVPLLALRPPSPILSAAPNTPSFTESSGGTNTPAHPQTSDEAGMKTALTAQLRNQEFPDDSSSFSDLGPLPYRIAPSGSTSSSFDVIPLQRSPTSSFEDLGELRTS